MISDQTQLIWDLEGLVSGSGGLNDRCNGHGRRKGRENGIDEERDDGEEIDGQADSRGVK